MFSENYSEHVLKPEISTPSSITEHLKCLIIADTGRPSKWLDELIVTLYKLNIYPSVHKQLIRTFFRGTHCMSFIYIYTYVC